MHVPLHETHFVQAVIAQVKKEYLYMLLTVRTRELVTKNSFASVRKKRYSFWRYVFDNTNQAVGRATTNLITSTTELQWDPF